MCHMCHTRADVIFSLFLSLTLSSFLFFQIFSYLDNEDLTEASLVSKENHRLAMHDAVWHFLPANNDAP